MHRTLIGRQPDIHRAFIKHSSGIRRASWGIHWTAIGHASGIERTAPKWQSHGTNSPVCISALSTHPSAPKLAARHVALPSTTGPHTESAAAQRWRLQCHGCTSPFKLGGTSVSLASARNCSSASRKWPYLRRTRARNDAYIYTRIVRRLDGTWHPARLSSGAWGSSHAVRCTSQCDSAH